MCGRANQIRAGEEETHCGGFWYKRQERFPIIEAVARRAPPRNPTAGLNPVFVPQDVTKELGGEARTKAPYMAVHRSWVRLRALFNQKSRSDVMAKQKWRVWHAAGPRFLFDREPAKWCPWLYYLVAEVEAESPDEVFGLTNHTEGDWTTNEGVRAVVDSPRSTKPGDVVVDGEGSPYFCRPTRWKRLRCA